MFENAYALIIGIASYRNIRPLDKTLTDAQDIFDLLIDDGYCGYAYSHVKLLKDEAADRDGQRVRLHRRASPECSAREEATAALVLPGVARGQAPDPGAHVLTEAALHLLGGSVTVHQVQDRPGEIGEAGSRVGQRRSPGSAPADPLPPTGRLAAAAH